MARKKRVKDEEEGALPLPDFAAALASDAARAVIGIFFFALALFLGLSAFSAAGVAGELAFHYLGLLLGWGYALLPLSFIIASVIFFRSFDGQEVNALKIGSTVVFLFAALSLVEIAFPTKGGIVGSFIAAPLITAFDTIAAVVFLLAFVCAALVIAFEVHPVSLLTSVRSRWSALFPPLDTPVEEVEPVVIEAVSAPEPETLQEETPEEQPAPEEEATPKKKKGAHFWKPTEDEEPQIPIVSHAGVVYAPPPLSLLSKNKGKPEVGDVKANANIIKRTLQNFGIEVEMDEVSIGPTVTRYAMKPAEGVRLAKIVALQSNLELALAASPIRIEAPIPGKSLVGIEVPNVSRTTLGLGPMLSDTEFTQSDKPLLVGLGRGITGTPHYTDVAKMPHLLVAGTTGSGKSVMIHNLIVSLLYRCGPEQLRFVMVDPKRVELTLYNSIPHLLTPVITDAKKAILALKWLAKEMDRRYDILETEKVRDIASYHKNVLQPALEKRDAAGQEEGAEDTSVPESMPYIVVFIDELADIMQAYPRELEAGIVRLAQMSRAVGIHLILSTQRPSVKVITGLIKANVPARLALQVASQIDSRTILDMSGAEKLLGAGDMLFLSGEMSKPRRIQSPYVTEAEVKEIVRWIGKHYEHQLPHEIDLTDKQGDDGLFSAMIDGGEGDDDDLYEEARAAVMEAGKASTSYLQRKLRVGYSRAARLMDILEERGVIGPQDGSKPREVLGAAPPPVDAETTSEEV